MTKNRNPKHSASPAKSKRATQAPVPRKIHTPKTASTLDSSIEQAKTVAHDALETTTDAAETFVEATKHIGDSISKTTKKAAREVATTTRDILGDAGVLAKQAQQAVVSASGAVGGFVAKNPVPFALIGAGAAWLFVAASPRSRSAVSSAAGWVKDHSKTALDGVGSEARELIDGAGKLASTAGKQSRAIVKDAQKQIDVVSDSVATGYESHPFVFGAAALAAGALLGAILPRTSRENQLVGAARDKLTHSLATFSKDTFEKAQDVAERIFDAGNVVMNGSRGSARHRASA